ncbi:MAG: small multi-drug export protein [Candidatus Omnitrophica bacterium]|nr:small multi-drug export protein [Candidatus Omnitrophota bacterium]
MSEWFLSVLGNLPPQWLVVIVSAMPVSELRGAIPIGIMLGLTPAKVFVLAILGNLIPVLPLLYSLEPVSEKLRKFSFFKKFFDWLFERTKKKSKIIEKYELIGLIIFVAVPLPMTGAWTGCIAASMLKLEKKLSFFAVAAGVAVAAVIVSVITLSAKGYFANVR